MELCDFVVDAWNSIPKDLLIKSFHATGQAPESKIEDVHALKPGSKAEDAFDEIKAFWDKELAEFDLKLTEEFLVVPSNHHNEENELFLIDSDNETD